MKNIQTLTLSFFLLLLTFPTLAQPFSIDDKIIPIKLELKESKDEAKGIVAITSTDKELKYFYVKGHSMFQLIDIFIFSNYDDPNFTAKLVYNNWKDIKDTKTSATSKNGIINFKLRANGDFGFFIDPNNQKINFTIVIKASKPVKEYLGNAFRKATPQELDGTKTQTTNTKNTSNTNPPEEKSSNTLLYVLLGLALLVIGFLASKVLSKNKATTILLLILFSTSFNSFAQEGSTAGVQEFSLDDFSTQAQRYLEDKASQANDAANEFELRLDRMGEVGSWIRDQDTYKSYKQIKDLYEAYKGLSSCINSVPVPGMPKLPSFCTTEDCGKCFDNARGLFNTARYQFEKLSAIYNCTVDFSKKAISYGDDVSPATGYGALEWQRQRRIIEKSLVDLDKAYDRKYLQLLDRLKTALMELDECESQHGLPDWYDRFGYMYYEFTELKYKRK